MFDDVRVGRVARKPGPHAAHEAELGTQPVFSNQSSQVRCVVSIIVVPAHYARKVAR
jgi:hypothetical protein